MEDSEVGHAEKADALRTMFKREFLHFIVTAHPAGIPGEERGKGSNVNWAVRKTREQLPEINIDPTRLILTIVDADASIPEPYIREV